MHQTLSLSINLSDILISFWITVHALGYIKKKKKNSVV